MFGMIWHFRTFLYVSCVLQNVCKDSCFGQGQSAFWVMISYAVYRCYGCNCRAVRNHSDLQCQTQGPGIARISYSGGGSVSRHRTGNSLPCDMQIQCLWVNHIREYLSQVYNKYLSCIKTYRSIFQTGGGEREAFTWISRFSTILHSIFIGRKIQGYHSHRNQKYNLHSRSNGCTWGATDSNRPIPISGHFT